MMAAVEVKMRITVRARVRRVRVRVRVTASRAVMGPIPRWMVFLDDTA